MAKLGLVRVDDRLIHGQVVTTWINATKSNRIIIVDDELKNNSFLSNIYTMAAPKGLKVEIKSTDQVAEEWEKNKLGLGTALILFKSINALSSSFKKGFKFTDVQIAGLASSSDKKRVFKSIGLSYDEALILNNLNQKGVNVNFQSMPDEKKVELKTVIGKYFQSIE